MSDGNRKFWKETIGVRPSSGRRTSNAGATGTIGTQTPPVEATKPERADGRIGVRSPARAESTTGPATARIKTDVTAEALGRLSVGSSSFARDVEKYLWPAPTPDDLRALSAVAGERHRIPDDERRRLTVSAVGLRMRIEGLMRVLSRPVLDATILQARAVEWARVTRLAGELSGQLAPREDDERGVDVLEAARSLLPTAHGIEAEARLATEVAATVDAVLGGRAKEIIAAATHVPDIEALVAAIRDHKLRPGDGLYIEALSAGALARRVLEESADEIPLAGRVIRRVLGRFDVAVNETTNAHARDPQSKARLAAWLRFMRDMKSRIDETMSRPSDIDTGPVGKEAQTPRPNLSNPESERIVVQHLREVRKSAIKKGLSTRLPDLPEPPAPKTPEKRATKGPAPANETPHPAHGSPEPATTVDVGRERAGHPRVLGVTIAGIALALVLFGASFLLPRYENAPDVDAAAFGPGLTLLDLRPAGALLVATADPSWDRLPPEERRIAAGRLMSVAESRGFRAGILSDPSGRTLAVWSPGREPTLR